MFVYMFIPVLCDDFHPCGFLIVLEVIQWSPLYTTACCTCR